MAVCRKRSTNIAPDSLSTSYLIGTPPSGISITTLMSWGASLPTGILLRSMEEDCPFLLLRCTIDDLHPNVIKTRRLLAAGVWLVWRLLSSYTVDTSDFRNLKIDCHTT